MALLKLWKMRRLRISAISYLNTAPLMWDFEHGEPTLWQKTPRMGTQFEISYTLPSACARSLADGTADIGIIPAAAYTEIPGLQVLPEVAIASRRAVRSILLVSNVPMEKVRTVALDTSSMTSVALTKVLFEKWLGGGRTFTAMAPNVEQMLAEHDAGLLIGDPALKIDRKRYHTVDLAEEWIRHTGKPFVFAFWAVRADALKEASPVAGFGSGLSEIARSRTGSGQPQPDCSGVGSAIGHERNRRSELPYPEHPLPARCRMPGGAAVVLSLRGGSGRLTSCSRTAIREYDQRGRILVLLYVHLDITFLYVITRAPAQGYELAVESSSTMPFPGPGRALATTIDARDRQRVVRWEIARPVTL